jgi:hypothetical protein
VTDDIVIFLKKTVRNEGNTKTVERRRRRQACTYNVISRRVRVSIVAMENQ